jgi:hypothetical protein
VEAWDFAVAKDAKTLIVVFSRVVNNLSTPEQPQRSTFFVVAVGEFGRTSP